jgi:3',5'-cyclic AMP phosphodiesterase CpdA
LHVEHHPEVVPLVCARLAELAPDVLVVAGDVSGDADTLERALAALREAVPAAVFVPGNHDLWCRVGEASSRARYEEIVPERARRAGFLALGERAALIAGVRFCGVTGWYDYSLRRRDLDHRWTREHYRRGVLGALRWSDKARVRWPGEDGAPLDDPAVCADQVGRLTRQLADGAGAPTVVVTHHLPFAELVVARGEPWDFVHGFLGSERLGALIRGAPGVRLALCGHTHFRRQVTLEGDHGAFTAAASPVGYPREYRRMGLDLAGRVLDRVALFEV